MEYELGQIELRSLWMGKHVGYEYN